MIEGSDTIPRFTMAPPMKSRTLPSSPWLAPPASEAMATPFAAMIRTRIGCANVIPVDSANTTAPTESALSSTAIVTDDGAILLPPHAP